jgi:hypothetical protein
MGKLQVRIHPRTKSKASKVFPKQLRTETGEFVTVYAVDTNSPTFGNDFLAVFRKNVKKAREENRELFGSPDRVPEKA